MSDERLRGPDIKRARYRLGVASAAAIEAGELPSDEEWARLSEAVARLTAAWGAIVATLERAKGEGPPSA